MDMKRSQKAGTTSRMMTVVVIAALCVLMSLAGVLLFSNYKAQLELRRSSFEYFHQKARRESLQMGQFFKGWEAVLARIVHSRELDAYHENKALGMSMEYGLRASLLSIDRKFQQVMDESVVDKVRNFEAMEFVNIDGSVLVKSGDADMNDVFMNAMIQKISADGVEYVVERKALSARIFIVMPYVFKGTLMGRVVALVSNQAFTHAPLRENDGSGGDVGLGYKGTYLPVLHEKDAKPSLLMKIQQDQCAPPQGPRDYVVCEGIKGVDNFVLFSVPVDGTPFHMLVANPSRIVWSGWMPEYLFFVFIAVVIVFAIFLFVLWRASIRNALLQVDLSDQARRNDEIERKVHERTVELSSANVRLENEVEERKRAENLLRESDRRFMDVLYASQDAILLIGDRKFVDCNEATARMLGYKTREEFLMQHPSKLSPELQPDGQTSFDKANEMMRLAKERGFHRFEWMHRKANGDDFSVEVSLTPIVLHGKEVIHCVWRDITAYKLAEKAIRDSEAWWRSLVEEVPAVTFVLQRDGVVKSVNRSFAGNPVDHLTGRSLFDLLDLHEKKVLEDAFKQVFEKKLSVTYQSRVVTPQGTTLWYENHMGPIDNSGDVVNAVCLSFDITERKVADDLLREMSLAVEHSPVSVVITDRFGKIEYVNPRFTMSTGYRFQEIYGKVLRILRPGEFSTALAAELWQTLQAGRDWKGEYLEKRKDGSEFWELVTISPVVSQDGMVSHLIVLKEDITDRRRAQEQRDADLKFLSELLDAIPSPVFFKNNAGIYQKCNKAFEEYMGKPRDQIIGRRVEDLLPQELAEIHHRSDVEVAKKGGRYIYEAKALYADGTLHDVMMFKSVLKDRGGINNGLIGVILDITEHKRLEEELRTNEAQLIGALEEVKLFNVQLEQTQEKLLQQEKLAAIGFLAAGVAHEINNPLGFVHGNLTALEEYLDSLLQVLNLSEGLSSAVEAGDIGRAREIRLDIQEAKERLEIDYIVRDASKLIGQTRVGTDRIKKIVEGLRSFSRTDSGEMIMANINDVLDGVVNIIWNEIKYKAELVKDYGSVPMISCNPQQLGQVFVNLLVNASQAIPDKGHIKVSTFLQNEEVVIQVCDNGTGITPEHMSKIFDPFFTTKEPGKGTGLGLSISYDIVKKHGGRIEVKSDVGQGTVFTVYFPVKRP